MFESYHTLTDRKANRIWEQVVLQDKGGFILRRKTTDDEELSTLAPFPMVGNRFILMDYEETKKSPITITRIVGRGMDATYFYVIQK
ncbi:hypothetical protein KIH39_10370 [Telmatocola sphagniphila]|uniref:Uncharacterized protein n=1 Tax=Telmatocola sphagniphila TaxID=1123043 RepID=A0A8E6F098_9BACT|nr:hypothetical protein [Telmatocola sphagniphila]QVL34286.1 hypothetical protein KIH39_10370 [Telmatocola sphagniphila]